MNRLLPALAAACFSLAAATAMAQSPSSDPGKGPGQYGGPRHGARNCSQAADPAKCEAERKERYERVKQAREACKDKPDRQGCMAESYCAKAQDPAKCQAKAKEHRARASQRLDQRQAAHEACTGKRGDELQKCLYAQRGGSGRGGPDKK
jgi:alkanesulfonate monooxygenase SsuD/methylene tetrahydromethanopterin reductase-like flavin-dependent oxidoreductase (luciferase family)